MGQGDVMSIPPFGTVLGHGYVDSLFKGNVIGRGAGCPHPHTACCEDDDGSLMPPPPAWPGARMRSAGGVTAGAAVLSYGV